MIFKKSITELRKIKDDWQKKIDNVNEMNQNVDPQSFVGKCNESWLKKANKALKELDFRIKKMEMQEP